MTQPTLRFRPLRPAVASDGACRLDLLLTITAPPARPAATGRLRPPLNLALVIDRSGSMAGTKLSYARKAARFLAAELTGRDRLAIVSFDSHVQLVVPSTPVTQPQRFIHAINTIHSGGATALFDGWLAGATQVAEHLEATALNRVLLLSDGQANVGLTDPDAIAGKVAGLTQRGISSSAFGLGDSFDEDLMGAIASAGDGTLAHIESPQQLADLYASELQGLVSTAGRRVSLGVRGKHGAELVDLLNDFKPTGAGNHQLPNLRDGQELQIGLRLQLPAWRPDQEILSVRLAWDAPGTEERQELLASLTLPVLPGEELKQLVQDAAVAEQLALLEANRERKRVIAELDRGDLGSAVACIEGLRANLMAMPTSAQLAGEVDRLNEQLTLLLRDPRRSRKHLSRDAWRSSLNVWDEQEDRP
jgi:Ca-activated chloride channel family protein